MNRLCVLIVVDTAGALAEGTLLGNCYMVDTNGYLGSWQEATDQLHTVCEDGQEVVWSAAPVAATGQVSITGFSGPMVAQSVCVPRDTGDDGAWAGRVEAHGAFASYAYSVALSLHGTTLSATCFLKVV